MSRAFTAVLVACSVLATGVDTAAQSPAEKAASKAFKGDTKNRLKEFKANTKADFTNVLNALKTFESDGSLATDFNTIAQGNPSANPVTALSDALATFGRRMVGETEAALFGAANDATQRLSALGGGDGDTLGGGFPLGFYSGDGTSLDQLAAQIQKTTDKYYLQLEKKLLKSAKKIEKSAGVALTVRLNNPVNVHAAGPDGATATLSSSRPLVIDHFLSASLVGVATDSENVPVPDGILCAGGMCDPGKFDVNARVLNSGALVTSSALGPNGAGRWRFCDNNIGQFYGEGNYLLEVFQDGEFGGPSFASDIQVERIVVGLR